MRFKRPPISDTDWWACAHMQLEDTITVIQGMIESVELPEKA